MGKALTSRVRSSIFIIQLQIFLLKLNSSETFFVGSAKTILSAVHQHPQTWPPLLLPVWVNLGEVEERGVV